MKKVFFAFVAASVVVLSACNNKPAADANATPADTTAVQAAAAAAAPADTTAAAAAASTGETAASGSTGSTGK